MIETKGIFDELKEANNGEELTNEEKDRFLEKIDLEKNQEGYYLDAFGTPISFNGIRQLKRPYTRLNLNKYQQQEIVAIQNDYYYFRRNYCKILTKSGIGRPEPRDYQKRAEDILLTGEDTILFFPRQCITDNTNLNINKVKYTAKDLYKTVRKTGTIHNYNTSEDIKHLKPEGKYIESITPEKDLYINTPSGEVKILQVHKTIPFKKYRIELADGKYLEGAENHVIIDINNNEIYLKDSINKELIINSNKPNNIGGTCSSKVIKVIDLGVEENMYDLSLDSLEEVYFSNDILSHNSGKTVTIATYLLWKALTEKNINIGISANVTSLAKEVLDKIKKIYIEMPIWMQPGLMSWNKGSLEFDNGNKILTAASNGNAFRGYSLTILYCSHEDEIVTVRNKTTKKVEEISLKELNKRLMNE